MTIEELDAILTGLGTLLVDNEEALTQLATVREAVVGFTSEPVEQPPEGFESWTAALEASKAETQAMREKYAQRFVTGAAPAEEKPTEEPKEEVDTRTDEQKFADLLSPKKEG